MEEIKEESMPKLELNGEGNSYPCLDGENSCPYSSNRNSEDVRKFHILDETEDFSDSDKSLSYDSDIPDEEVDKMLEEALASKKRKASAAGLGK